MSSGGIRLLTLRLRGLTRDYEVSFADGLLARPLSIVAGQISTGKSSVLEFCDYCLGAQGHPMHEEFRRAGIRAALLEVLLDGQPHVIERSAFSHELQARVHSCALGDLSSPHPIEIRPLKPAGSEASLSTLLLRSCGLSGVLLKEAPTKDASAADPLSFRDVMSLCFLPNERLGSKVMLHESEPPKAIKLRQVIEAIFGIHEQAAVRLSAELQLKETRKAEAEGAAAVLARFLDEHHQGNDAALVDEVREIRKDLAGIEEQIADLDDQLRAQTDFAASLRTRYAAASTGARERAAQLRDRETLLRRLLPLRGQYVADIARLRFFGESRLLFDPLAVKVCPACHAELPSPPTIAEGHCSLCGQDVRPREDDVDPEREVRLTEARLNELDRYIREVETEVSTQKERLAESAREEIVAQQDLDAQVAASLAPYVQQRDQLTRTRERLAISLQGTEQARQFRAGVTQREAEVDRLARDITELRDRIKRLRETQPTRQALAFELSTRFEALLRDFGFPKLSDAVIDDRYSPHARGLGYAHLSSGARTLVGIAWHLAVLEQAVEAGAAHPGFLMLDGIQKNLRPVQADDPDSEFRRPEIVTRIYDHLTGWAAGSGSATQLIVVDNAPPQGARPFVVVEFSADAGRPPYGLIDDAVD
jgi:hypothetical protein